MFKDPLALTPQQEKHKAMHLMFSDKEIEVIQKAVNETNNAKPFGFSLSDALVENANFADLISFFVAENKVLKRLLEK